MTKKTIVITGGSSGIGASIIRSLLEAKHNLINIDLKPSDLCETITCDFGEISELEPKLSKILDGVDLYAIIANAGIHSIESTSDNEIFERIVNTNLCATYSFIDMMIPKLIESRWETKHVVMTSSISSFTGIATNPGYAASKAGIDSLARSLAMKHASDNILVNTVNPGWVDTHMLTETLDKYSAKLRVDKDDIKKSFCAKSLTQRVADPAEVAKYVAFIISDTQRSITGQNLVIDNGYLLR